MIKMNIILLNASPNEGGNTYQMLSEISNLLNDKKVLTEIINIPKAVLSAKTPFCSCCSNPCNATCYQNTLLELVYQKISESDGVIVGSPVYFGSMTAQLKAFFDKTRQIRGKKLWMYKPVACVTVGGSKYGGQETTIRAMHDMFLVQGMTIVGDGDFDSDCGHFGVSAQRDALSDEAASKRYAPLASRIYNMAKNYREFIKNRG